MKKYAIFLAVLLAACGGGGSNSTDSTGAASATPEASAPTSASSPTLTGVSQPASDSTPTSTTTPAATPAKSTTAPTSSSSSTTTTTTTSTPSKSTASGTTSTPSTPASTPSATTGGTTTAPSTPASTPSTTTGGTTGGTTSSTPPVTSTPSTPSTPASTPAVSTPASDPAATSGTVLDTSFGVKGDGTTDDTKALQAAIDGSVGQILTITGQSRINATGLTLHSNSHIKFASGASLKLLPYNTDSYQMIRVWDVSNVIIENAYLDGSKELNSMSSGEWGMGISVEGATNVEIDSPTTINCWGDGIYIDNSSSGSNAVSSNITVNNHVSDSNRRQGASIISGNGITFNSPIWKNTAGTSPSAGLDIEPDNNNDVLKAIKINSPQTSNNAGAGIEVYLGSFYGPVAKTVDIAITNHVDTNTTVGPFGVGGLGSMGSSVVTGTITSTNPVWTETWYQGDWSSNGPKISVVNPTIN